MRCATRSTTRRARCALAVDQLHSIAATSRREAVRKVALKRNKNDAADAEAICEAVRRERVSLFGTDQRITSRPAARRPHSKAEFMTAPERFADSQIPLAPRAPSIHVSRQSAPRLIGDATAALASLCRPQTISCRDGVHLLGGGLPGLMDSIRRCRTGG